MVDVLHGNAARPDGQTRDHMGVASSPDLLHWSDATDIPVLPRRPGAFDSRVMEPGPRPFSPVRASCSITAPTTIWSTAPAGFFRCSRSNPFDRAPKSPSSSRTPFGKTGVVPNVIFLEGMVAAGRDPLTLTGYYGAADTSIGASNCASHSTAAADYFTSPAGLTNFPSSIAALSLTSAI